jgi:hypothetical protein
VFRLQPLQIHARSAVEGDAAHTHADDLGNARDLKRGPRRAATATGGSADQPGAVSSQQRAAIGQRPAASLHVLHANRHAHEVLESRGQALATFVGDIGSRSRHRASAKNAKNAKNTKNVRLSDNLSGHTVEA